jgi:hypothetical protein
VINRDIYKAPIDISHGTPTLATIKERFSHIQASSAKYAVTDYLSSSLASPFHNVQVWALEVILVRGCNLSTLYNHANQYGIDSEVVSIAANILDRCLMKWVPKLCQCGDTPFHFEMYCYIALSLAIKTRIGRHQVGKDRQIPSIAEFLPNYSTAMIHAAEVNILYELQWNLLFPTPASIVRDLLSILRVHLGVHSNDVAFHNYQCDVLREAVLLTELATLHYSCSIFSPITVALASVMCAIRSINRFLLLQEDPLQVFKDAVHSQLGDLGISCDASEVHECGNRIYAIGYPSYQKTQVWHGSNPYHVPVSP